MRIQFRHVLLLTLIVNFLCSTVAAAVERVAGTHVSLNPPPNFEKADKFPGFMREEYGASIMVMELPGPFDEYRAGIEDKDHLSTRGMRLLQKEAVRVDNRDGLLVHLSQVLHSLEFRKWVLLIGERDRNVMVMANYPAELEEEFSMILRESVLSTLWDPDQQVSKEEGLNFTLTESGSMRLAERMGNMLMYSKDAQVQPRSVDDPILIAGSALTDWPIGDRKEFSRKRLQLTATVTAIEIETLDEVRVDGLEAVEILAKAKDTDSGKEIRLYQMMVFKGQTYYLIQGMVSLRREDEFMADFQAMARSFKCK
ncbi:MAG: hypothetical protein KC900_03345 [Candidatus Omnitrophica bacterium]|nr:hypothetical protein [Candidatus Omnitrophota bacterium]